jgi:hypothetical protein
MFCFGSSSQWIGREHPYVMEAAPLGGLSDLLFWLWFGFVATYATICFGKALTDEKDSIVNLM